MPDNYDPDAPVFKNGYIGKLTHINGHPIQTTQERLVEEFYRKYYGDEFSYPDGEFTAKFVGDWLRTALTTIAAEAREEERTRIEQWVNKNYSRSAQPLYAHVDAKDLMLFITPQDPLSADKP